MSFHLKIDDQLFNQIFPFSFVLNREMNIIHAGRSLRKLNRQVVGSLFSAIFKIKRPRSAGTSFQSVVNFSQQIFILEIKTNYQALWLRGQMIALDEDQLAFLGSPWINSVDDIQYHGLNLHDYALHDSMPDMLQVLKTEEIANEDIRKLNEQFLANTSHELRTPLQGIIGLSESLMERHPRIDQKEALSMIISSGKRLASMVNDILDFSKLKNHSIRLIPRPVDLYTMIDIVLRNITPLVKGKDLRLINAVSGDLPLVMADENRLQQILFNLVGNAIKFTESGHVRIHALENEKTIQVAVEDTGTGIPEYKQEMIFQEFEQSDGLISREFEGTGLGLSISKRLVELQGGQMWVESTCADRERPEASADKLAVTTGSTFYFTLPLAPTTATLLTTAKEVIDQTAQKFFTSEDFGFISGKEQIADSRRVRPQEKGQMSELIRILVVDDEPINQEVLKNHLSGKGFQLTQAMNGQEALKAIDNALAFDLVLLDIMMPRMSGYEVCQKIREKYLPSELPIIMITAKDQLQDIVQGLGLGANDYLPKPFHKEELLARIQTQLDLHRIFKAAGRFVPFEFLHSLERKRITEVLLGDHTEQEVTVLFADIRDYTTLAETMSPEQNFRFINAFHGRMGPVIQQNGGFVNQYLGDAVMAIFLGNPDDALRAAIEMQQVLRDYNLQRQRQDRVPLKMGVGMHTGLLIMGIIGDMNRMDAAIIADVVNTASRIESLTKHFGASILFSEDSMVKMNKKSNFHYRSLGKVVVKGKTKPVGLYECYDGESPAVITKKTETISDFEIGVEQFYDQEFPKAIGTFDKVLKINADDQPARLFMNKSSEYLLKGIPDNWSGMDLMTVLCQFWWNHQI